MSHKAEHAAATVADSAPASANSVWAATSVATAPALPQAGVAPPAARVTRATLIPGEYYRFRCTLCNRYAGWSARSAEYFWLPCRYCGGRSDVNTDIQHVTDKAQILASEQEDVPHRPVSSPWIAKD